MPLPSFYFLVTLKWKLDSYVIKFTFKGLYWNHVNGLRCLRARNCFSFRVLLVLCWWGLWQRVTFSAQYKVKFYEYVHTKCLTVRAKQ